MGELNLLGADLSEVILDLCALCCSFQYRHFIYLHYTDSFFNAKNQNKNIFYNN